MKQQASDSAKGLANSARGLAKKKAKANRTDAAGRSGMGESASSNIKTKSGADFSSANKTGIGAFKKKLKSTGDSSKAADAMYGSIENAYKYADSKRKK
jgi:hypothetical protein